MKCLMAYCMVQKYFWMLVDMTCDFIIINEKYYITDRITALIFPYIGKQHLTSVTVVSIRNIMAWKNFDKLKYGWVKSNFQSKTKSHPFHPEKTLRWFCCLFPYIKEVTRVSSSLVTLFHAIMSLIWISIFINGWSSSFKKCCLKF